MSKRRKTARAAKAKRQQAARQANWWRHWPYFAVGGVAVALVAALPPGTHVAAWRASAQEDEESPSVAEAFSERDST